MRTRPTEKPRLADIDPEAIAREVIESVRGQMVRLGLCFAPYEVQLPTVDELMHSALRLKVQSLTEFAKTGALGDWPDSFAALDALEDVCTMLHGQLGKPKSVVVDSLVKGSGDVGTALGVVVVASYARVRLYRDKPVTARQLACLAEVSPAHLRLLARRGEIEFINPRKVAAADATRWLRMRGVPGFPQRTPRSRGKSGRVPL